MSVKFKIQKHSLDGLENKQKKGLVLIIVFKRKGSLEFFI